MAPKSDAKQRILREALGLMHERGYANVGVEEIMQAAKVGKGSFYHFFKSKETLGEAVLDEYGRGVLQPLLDKAFAPPSPPLERPLRLISTLGEGDGPVLGCLAGNSAAENSTISERLRERTAGVMERVRSAFEEAYLEAVAEMELHPDTPVRELAAASVAYLQGLMLLCRLERSWEPMRRYGNLIKGLWKPYEV